MGHVHLHDRAYLYGFYCKSNFTEIREDMLFATYLLGVIKVNELILRKKVKQYYMLIMYKILFDKYL